MDLNALPLIGMTGVARAGKDTCAATLIEEFGFVRYAFADRMKTLMRRTNPFVDGCLRYSEHPGDPEASRLRAALSHVLSANDCGIEITDPRQIHELLLATNPFINGATRLDSLVMRTGWEAAKDDPHHGREARGLLQRFGTDAAREVISDTVWVDECAYSIAYDGRRGMRPVVITDVRFDSEAEWVKRSGGLIWQVRRPGYGPVNGHKSEQGIDPELVDSVVDNDGTLDDLAVRMRDLVLTQFNPA